MKLGLFSYKSGSLFNCDSGSVLAYQIHKGVEIVSGQSKLTFSDFVIEDRFELNSYISYLFHQVKNNVDQSKNKMVKH